MAFDKQALSQMEREDIPKWLEYAESIEEEEPVRAKDIACQILELEPEHLDALWLIVGSLLADESQPFSEIEPWFKRILSIAQDDMTLWHVYASMLWDEDRLQDALQAYNNALKYSDATMKEDIEQEMKMLKEQMNIDAP